MKKLVIVGLASLLLAPCCGYSNGLKGPQHINFKFTSPLPVGEKSDVSPILYGPPVYKINCNIQTKSSNDIIYLGTGSDYGYISNMTISGPKSSWDGHAIHLSEGSIYNVTFVLGSSNPSNISYGLYAYNASDESIEITGCSAVAL